MAHRRYATVPDTVDWQNERSIWHAQPMLHRMKPGGCDYGRYLWVRDQIPAGSRVLDVGCGAGQFAENISCRLDCEVCGVDVVHAFVYRCNTAVRKALLDARKPIGWFVCADFSKMTADQVRSLGQFDVVTALEVIEHPVDVRGFLRNVNLALKQTGNLIITTPHPDSQIIGYEYKAKHPHHVRMWTRWRLEQVFGPAATYAEIAQDRESELGGDVSHICAVFRSTRTGGLR